MASDPTHLSMPGAAWLAYLLLAARPAAAEPPPVTPGPTAADTAAPSEPTAAHKETARALMDEGDRQTSAGDHAGALRSYLAADRLMGVATTSLAVGETLARLGRLLEARDALLRALRSPVTSGESAAQGQARQRADALALDLAARIPSLSIIVSGPAATLVREVTLDGTPLASELLGVPHRLDPGEHRVRAAAPGFLGKEVTVTLVESERRVLELPLEPETAPPPPPGPPTRAVAPTVVAPPGPPTPTADTEVPVLAIAGFGVGALGLAAGAICGGLVLSRQSAIEEQCPNKRCSAEGLDEVDRATALAHASTASLVVGGVGVGLGVVALLTGSSPEQVALIPAPGGAGLRIRF